MILNIQPRLSSGPRTAERISGALVFLQDNILANMSQRLKGLEEATGVKPSSTPTPSAVDDR